MPVADIQAKITLHRAGDKVSAGARLATAVQPTGSCVGHNSGHHSRLDHDSSEYSLCRTSWTNGTGRVSFVSFVMSLKKLKRRAPACSILLQGYSS